MKHRINGCRINLRLLSGQELARITHEAAERVARAQEEFDSLRGEAIRRRHFGVVVPLHRPESPATVA